MASYKILSFTSFLHFQPGLLLISVPHCPGWHPGHIDDSKSSPPFVSFYSLVIGLKGQRTYETRCSHRAACLLPCLCSSLGEYLYSFCWPFLDQNTDSKVGNGAWGVSMYFVRPSQPRRSRETGWIRTLLNSWEWTRIQCVSCLLWSAAGCKIIVMGQ